MQKRIGMFKSSGANIKKISKFIRSCDISSSIELLDFHVKRSADLHLLFPVGSEASIANSSGASSDIWSDSTGFKKRVDQYRLSANGLREALKSKNVSLINENFDSLLGFCKSCHQQFRN